MPRTQEPRPWSDDRGPAGANPCNLRSSRHSSMRLHSVELSLELWVSTADYCAFRTRRYHSDSNRTCLGV